MDCSSGVTTTRQSNRLQNNSSITTPCRPAPRTPLSRSIHKTPLTPRTPSRVVEPLLGRVKELTIIKDFISQHISEETSGSLYISGMPGTGKTACIDAIYRAHQGIKCKINCMAIEDPKTIYSLILSDLEGRNDSRLPGTPSRSQRHLEKLEKLLQQLKAVKLIVLDEIDQLGTKDSALLDKIFLWPTLPGYHVIVIGVANKLDLTTKLFFPSAMTTPNKLHFAPYSKKELTEILDSKIEMIKEEEGVEFHPAAVALCAGRIANRSGDIRMAMSVVKRSARDVVTPAKRRRMMEISENDPVEIADRGSDVKISDVQAVMSEQSATRTLSALPLQQRILICCGLLLSRAGKQITFRELETKYNQIREAQSLPPLSSPDVLHFCEILGSLGVFNVKKNKNDKSIWKSVVTFQSEQDAEFNIIGKPLMDSILNGTGANL